MKIYNFTDIFGYSDGERTFCIRVSESELKQMAKGQYWSYSHWRKEANKEHSETMKETDTNISKDYFNNYITLIDYMKENSIN